MLIEGVWLMVVGMTTVFAFLGLLVVSMHGLAWVVAQLPPEPEPQAELLATASAQIEQDEPLDEIAVVLAVIAQAQEAR